MPVIIASTKEALASVPLSFREACWNVGATRWQTIRHVVLPNSISGILTGVLLLASQKTSGLILVALSCVLFVPGGAYFVWQEASHTGEMYLFAAAFLPGIISGWACVFAFGKPMWAVLRG